MLWLLQFISHLCFVVDLLANSKPKQPHELQILGISRASAVARHLQTTHAFHEQVRPTTCATCIPAHSLQRTESQHYKATDSTSQGLNLLPPAELGSVNCLCQFTLKN